MRHQRDTRRIRPGWLDFFGGSLRYVGGGSSIQRRSGANKVPVVDQVDTSRDKIYIPSRLIITDINNDNLPDVVTSLEFERILSASGPTQGHLTRRSKDHEEPKKIAWFQCIGSRDEKASGKPYCSRYCCMLSTMAPTTVLRCCG